MDEQVFLQTLKKIRWSTNRADLAIATSTALGLLLRRPADHQLLASLLAQVDKIIGSNGSARQAAVRCVVLLQSAKQGRLSRSQHKKQTRQRQIMLLIPAATIAVALYMGLTLILR
jgi:hypothetical protein